MGTVKCREDSNFKAHLLRISKVPQLGFFEFESLNDSLSVVVGQCLNS